VLPPPFRNGAAHSENLTHSQNVFFVPESTILRMRGRSENASNREWESDSGMSIPERSIILSTVDHSENDRAVPRTTGRFSEQSGHSQIHPF
jgi:hypothetical protein